MVTILSSIQYKQHINTQTHSGNYGIYLHRPNKRTSNCNDFFLTKKHKQIETNFLNEFHILNGTKKNRMFASQTDLNYIN